MQREDEFWKKRLENDRESLRGLGSSAMAVKVEEAQRELVETDLAWQERLAVVEHDLQVARAELMHERESTMRAQADGEMAVLRTIEGFWQAQKEGQPPPN